MQIDAVPDAPLPSPPLALVVAQVRFPRTPGLVTEHAEAALAALLPDLPVRRPERGTTVSLGDGLERRAFRHLTFASTDDAVRVVLSEDFVSVAGGQYLGRDRFAATLEPVLAAVAAVATPATVDRVGVRFVFRLVGGQVDALADRVRPELLGCLSGELTPTQQVSAAVIPVGPHRLYLRTVLLPANEVHDPALVPVDGRSWALDLDAVAPSRAPFAVPGLLTVAADLAGLALRGYRWAVQPGFAGVPR